MKLEQQCCSLELAKKLKELGVKQESLFVWWVYDNGEADIIDSSQKFEKGRIKDFHFSAFTVAELGDMLPNTEECISRKEPNEKEWRCGNQIESTEADARAKMLIYLLENNLITL